MALKLIKKVVVVCSKCGTEINEEEIKELFGAKLISPTLEPKRVKKAIKCRSCFRGVKDNVFEEWITFGVEVKQNE